MLTSADAEPPSLNFSEPSWPPDDTVPAVEAESMASAKDSADDGESQGDTYIGAWSLNVF